MLNGQFRAVVGDGAHIASSAYMRTTDRPGRLCYGTVPRAGSNSSTWVRRMLLPDGSRKEVSMP